MANKKFGTFDASTNTEAITVAQGDSTERPAAALGQLRYNTEYERLESYDGTAWVASQNTYTRVRGTEVAAFTVDKSFDNTLTKLDSAVAVTFDTVLTAADFEDGFKFTVENIGTADFTFDPQGSETVSGQVTMQVPSGFFASFYCDGSNWIVFNVRPRIISDTLRDLSPSSQSDINNFISAEDGTGGWALYNDNTFFITDGTGGTPTAGFTWTTTGASPISGTQSFLLDKPAANCFGQGVSYDFELDGFMRGTTVSIDLHYKYVSGIENFDNLRAMIYDVDNSEVFQLAPGMFIQTDVDGEVSLFSGSFIPKTGVNYRLCIHCTARHSEAFSVQIDDIIIRQGERKIIDPHPEGVFMYTYDADDNSFEHEPLPLSIGNFSGYAFSNREQEIITGNLINVSPSNTWELYIYNIITGEKDFITQPTIAVSSQALIRGAVYSPQQNKVYMPYTRYTTTPGGLLEINLATNGVTTHPLSSTGLSIRDITYCPSSDEVFLVITNTISSPPTLSEIYSFDCSTNAYSSALVSISSPTAEFRSILYCPYNDFLYTCDSGGTTRCFNKSGTLQATFVPVNSMSAEAQNSFCWDENENCIVVSDSGIVIDAITNTVLLDTSGGSSGYMAMDYKTGYYYVPRNTGAGSNVIGLLRKKFKREGGNSSFATLFPYYDDTTSTFSSSSTGTIGNREQKYVSRQGVSLGRNFICA